MTQALSKGAAPTETELAAMEMFDQQTGMETRPDFLKASAEGTEDIGRDDVRIPRLGFAQGLSPQIVEGDPDFIEGLAVNDMFNDVTKENYKRGPIFLIVCRRDMRGIEFKPRSEGGGVVDINVPLDKLPNGKYRDKRLEWDGQTPPRATIFTEYLCLRVVNKAGDTEELAISLKHTNKANRDAIRDLNGYIRAHANAEKATPIYGVIYAVSSYQASNKKNQKFAAPKFEQVTFIRSKELVDRAIAYRESLGTKTLMIAREPGDDAIDGEVAGDEKVPF